MKNVIYSKFSNERARQFSIRTDICQDGEERWVEKVAAAQEAQSHVEQLVRWQELLGQQFAGSGVFFDPCEKVEGGVRLAYISGGNLEEYLDDLLDRGEEERAFQSLMTYARFLQRIHSDQAFTVTPEFVKVFGEVSLPQGLLSGKISDIDLVCANLMTAEPATVIDYEWTFDFPIPGNYVVYRMLHYYLDTHSKRQRLHGREPYGQLGITEAELEAYRQMEIHFQRYITDGHVPMREMYRDISPGAKGVTVLQGEQLQVYESYGDGFQEKNSRCYPIREEKVHMRAPVSEGVNYLRVDPGSCACAVKIHKLNFQPGDVPAQYHCEDGWASGQWLYIAREDPNLTNIPVPEGAKELEIYLEIHPVDLEFLGELAGRLRRDAQENRELRVKVAQRENQIRQMENTKVWKFYQGYRNKKERKR